MSRSTRRHFSHLDAGPQCRGPAVAVWIHGLRHYYATLLIHAGASVKTVQLALGHSNLTITLNTYVHEWPEAVDRTRSLIDGVLGVRETAATSARSRA